MKPARPRQDVAFLALAVAILAIAVALFVGLRSLSGRKQARAPAPPAPPKMAQKLPTPPPAKRQDPFKANPAPPQAAGKTKPPQAAAEFKLVGLMPGRQPLAVIRRGESRYYAKRGDRVAGYLVGDIGDGSVVLSKNGERVVLRLQRPRPEEGRVTSTSSRSR